MIKTINYKYRSRRLSIWVLETSTIHAKCKNKYLPKCCYILKHILHGHFNKVSYFHWSVFHHIPSLNILLKCACSSKIHMILPNCNQGIIVRTSVLPTYIEIWLIWTAITLSITFYLVEFPSQAAFITFMNH